VRVFTNDGSGTFEYSSDFSAPGYNQSSGWSNARETVFCDDEFGNQYYALYYYGEAYFSLTPANVTALAVGDLDGNGQPDIVVGTDRYTTGYASTDPTRIDFTTTPPYCNAAGNYTGYFYEYIPAVRVFFNDSGLTERSAQVLPLASVRGGTALPALHARDLALGDVDGDGSIDIVLTWDDPTTVSAYGRKSGTGTDSARVATRVLINDGDGFFSDDTADWLPSGSGSEFWQGNRLALVDIVGDSRRDLVLLDDEGPTATTSALRILRNDGTGTGFTDVSSSVLPALPSSPDDNFRGDALRVHDVDGDGDLDILIGASAGITDTSGDPLPATRFLRNDSGSFVLATGFLPLATADSGEAHDLLVFDDLESTTGAVLLLLTEGTPENSTDGESLRLFDWLE